MNDFDDIIGGAIGAHADKAPVTRPDFGDVLAERQQRLRRRSAVGAVGVLAIGVTGMAAFAVGGPMDSTADGPDTPVGSDGQLPTTTALAVTVEGSGPGATVWYCEGRLDEYAVFPTTTTIAPPTTFARPVESDPDDTDSFPDATYVAPIDDSGHFRNCVLVDGGSAVEVASADDDVTMTTYPGQFPTTTSESVPVPNEESGDRDADSVPVATSENGSQSYVVQSGDYAIKVADLFCVPLEDLIDFNGWDTGNEFPFPGSVIKIPPGSCISSPSVPCTTTGCDAVAIHTIRSGDYPIKIADDYCVDIADMITLNGWESGSEMGLPGDQVMIPAPPANGVCPDNGDSD